MLPYANDFAIAIQLFKQGKCIYSAFTLIFKKLRLPIFIQVVYNLYSAVIIGLDPVIICYKIEP